MLNDDQINTIVLNNFLPILHVLNRRNKLFSKSSLRKSIKRYKQESTLSFKSRKSPKIMICKHILSTDFKIIVCQIL